jgi:hypothetical protein
VNDVNFVEGQMEIEQPLRCAGKTKYGKTLNLTAVAEFFPSNPLLINPTESCVEIVKVTYGNLFSEKSYTVTYKTLVEIEAARVAEEERIEMERLAEEERIRNLPPSEYDLLRARVIQTEQVIADTNMFQQELLELLIDLEVI